MRYGPGAKVDECTANVGASRICSGLPNMLAQLNTELPGHTFVFGEKKYFKAASCKGA